MKRIDTYIRENRNGFDTHEPPDGHFQRFRGKSGYSPGLAFRKITAWAAIFICAIIISLNLIPGLSSRSARLPADLEETAWFYTNRSENIISQIKQNNYLRSGEKQLILKDIRNFEKDYTELLSDLKEYPEDERLINAFIDYHRLRVEFLEGIINQLDQRKLI